jgi:DNA-binding transcriptional MerR regulator
MENTTTQIPEKLFYKAAEVCQITDTQPYVLRFWESEFPQLASEKNRGGQRVYRRSDIDLVFRIKKLLYQEEYTIAGARKAIDDDLETVVEPAQSKSRAKRSTVVDEQDAPPAPAAPTAPPSLFGESRPESPEAPTSPAVAEDLRYRALYEEAMATLTTVKGDLARSDGHLDAMRERNRRLAARLEASLQS